MARDPLLPNSPEDLTDHTVIRPREDCTQLFNLFMGIGPGLMLPPLQFLAKTKLLERNLISYRDRFEHYYQKGIGTNIADIQRFLDYQRSQRALMPWVTEEFCIGSSVGGYAAILSGHVNKAKKVYAFAPPTIIPDNARITGPGRVSAYEDLSKLLQNYNGETDYHIYYNESEKTDRQQAELLKNYPGVHLHPQQGQGHGVVFELLKTNQLGTMMPPMKKADQKSEE